MDDPRYDAVGSSSLREELFTTFLKAHQHSQQGAPKRDNASPSKVDQTSLDPIDKERIRQERKERAVREREEKVKAERSKLDAQIDRSRMGMNKEEGEREFRCAQYMLTIDTVVQLAPITHPAFQDDAG